MHAITICWFYTLLLIVENLQVEGWRIRKVWREQHCIRQEIEAHWPRREVKALLGSLSARFKGLMQILRIVAIPTDEDADAVTFGKDIYLVASVLDPVYGFIWLKEDHPGSPDVKSALRSYITDAIIHQASLVDAKHPSKPDQAIVPTENDSVPCASSSNTQPSLNDTNEPLKIKKRRSHRTSTGDELNLSLR